MTTNGKIIAGLAVLVLLGGVALATKNTLPKTASQSGKVFCQQDGTLSATQTIQSHRSYCVDPGATGGGYSVNTPTNYTFSIVDDQGNVVKNFVETHTMLLHFIVVRKDLAYFQHLHPDFDLGTGMFTLSGLTFPADGEYRIFADFATADMQKDAMGMPLTATPYEDVLVGNAANYTPQPIGSTESTKTFDGLTVTVSTHGTPTSGTENMVMFTLKQNGKPVTDLQPYLGALGHAVILREGNLDYIHAHPIEDVSAPQNGTVSFMVDFPEAGTYKAFTQFQRNGQVITTDFVLNVVQGTNSESSMPGMDMQSGMQMNMQGMSH